MSKQRKKERNLNIQAFRSFEGYDTKYSTLIVMKYTYIINRKRLKTEEMKNASYSQCTSSA